MGVITPKTAANNPESGLHHSVTEHHPSPILQPYFKPKHIAFITCTYIYVHVENSFGVSTHVTFPVGVWSITKIFYFSDLLWEGDMWRCALWSQNTNCAKYFHRTGTFHSVCCDNNCLCLQFLCNKKGKKHSGLFRTPYRRESLIRNDCLYHTSHLEEPCRQSLFAPLFLTQKLHTTKESYLSLTRMSEP